MTTYNPLNILFDGAIPTYNVTSAYPVEAAVFLSAGSISNSVRGSEIGHLVKLQTKPEAEVVRNAMSIKGRHNHLK